MSFMFTRVKVGDYEAWKRHFEADPYGAREKALGYRICRGVEDPNEVFIQVSSRPLRTRRTRAESARRGASRSVPRDHWANGRRGGGGADRRLERPGAVRGTFVKACKSAVRKAPCRRGLPLSSAAASPSARPPR